MGHVVPYGISKECLRRCPVDAGGTLLLWAAQVFLLVGEVGLMPPVDTRCTVRGRGRPRAEKHFDVYVFLVLP